jgi:hypothetical protein
VHSVKKTAEVVEDQLKKDRRKELKAARKTAKLADHPPPPTMATNAPAAPQPAADAGVVPPRDAGNVSEDGGDNDSSDADSEELGAAAAGDLDADEDYDKRYEEEERRNQDRILDEEREQRFADQEAERLIVAQADGDSMIANATTEEVEVMRGGPGTRAHVRIKFTDFPEAVPLFLNELEFREGEARKRKRSEISNDVWVGWDRKVKLRYLQDNLKWLKSKDKTDTESTRKRKAPAQFGN